MKTTMLAAIVIAVGIGNQLLAETPKVGEKVPDFSLPDISGNVVRLADRIADGPVVLIVLRGYPGYQCPYCNRQVADFLHNAPSFSRLGTRVVFVYPGPADELQQHATEFAAGRTMPKHFDLLLDADYKATELYGLRWNAPHETAYPSTFVISRKGEILFSKVSRQHGGRTTSAEVLDALTHKTAQSRKRER